MRLDGRQFQVECRMQSNTCLQRTSTSRAIASTQGCPPAPLPSLPAAGAVPKTLAKAKAKNSSWNQAKWLR